ncbi:MAG: sugar phosphate nucleotidyltransferase [Acidobacteriota bacterium]
MQIVILAGGLGTRLRPLTESVPKPLVPVDGVPFLERQIRFLAGQGFRDFLLLTGYRGEQIRMHLGDGSRLGVRLGYSHEEHPLGTGGALRQALGRLGERFLLVYGDSFLAEDHAAVAAAFEGREDADGMMVVYRDRNGETGVSPNVALDEAGRVKEYAKGSASPELRYIEAGVLGLTAGVLGGIPPGRKASLEAEVYPRLVEAGRMAAWVTRRRFYDIGTPEGMRMAETFFRGREAEGGGR